MRLLFFPVSFPRPELNVAHQPEMDTRTEKGPGGGFWSEEPPRSPTPREWGQVPRFPFFFSPFSCTPAPKQSRGSDQRLREPPRDSSFPIGRAVVSAGLANPCRCFSLSSCCLAPDTSKVTGSVWQSRVTKAPDFWPDDWKRENTKEAESTKEIVKEGSSGKQLLKVVRELQA